MSLENSDLLYNPAEPVVGDVGDYDHAVVESLIPKLGLCKGNFLGSATVAGRLCFASISFVLVVISVHLYCLRQHINGKAEADAHRQHYNIHEEYLLPARGWHCQVFPQYVLWLSGLNEPQTYSINSHHVRVVFGLCQHQVAYGLGAEGHECNPAEVLLGGFGGAGDVLLGGLLSQPVDPPQNVQVVRQVAFFLVELIPEESVSGVHLKHPFGLFYTPVELLL